MRWLPPAVRSWRKQTVHKSGGTSEPSSSRLSPRFARRTVCFTAPWRKRGRPCGRRPARTAKVGLISCGESLINSLAVAVFKTVSYVFTVIPAGSTTCCPSVVKGRGFFPSCGARRMAATAAHLTDPLIPRVPTRQWVVSLPFDLRFRLAFDRVLCGEVRTLFARAVIARQRRQATALAGDLYVKGWVGGAATWTQRFGDGLRLNIHFHAVVLGGAFHAEEQGAPRFAGVPAPIPRDLSRVASRVTRGLRRRLAELDSEEEIEPAYLAEDATLVACLCAARRDMTALAYPDGPLVGRLMEDSRPGASRQADDAQNEAGGFNLHAGPRIAANDRKRLERLCRYAGRPSLSEARLGQQGDGCIIFHLKRPWSGGTRALLFTPLQLVERLALMVPPPRAHVVTYHGVVSSHSAHRAQLTPESQPAPSSASAILHAERELVSSAAPSQPARV